MVKDFDLIFTKDSFSYQLVKGKAFRNYLNIFIPEIVNMPDLGFEMELWKNISYSNSVKRQFIETWVINGASAYNILVKSYTSEVVNFRLNFNNVVFG